MKPENAIRPDHPAEDRKDRLAKVATSLGREIIEVSAVLESLDRDGQTQRDAIHALAEKTDHVVQINASVAESLKALAGSVDGALRSLDDVLRGMDRSAEASARMSAHSGELANHTTQIQPVIEAVQTNNEQILTIAAQVNMLAINAKIEAARAGEAGRGFSVVADAINELSIRTGHAAQDVTASVTNLTEWLTRLQGSITALTGFVHQAIEAGTESHDALHAATGDLKQAGVHSAQVNEDAGEAQTRLSAFRPMLHDIANLVTGGTEQLHSASDRVARLIDQSETLVQDSFILGGTSSDRKFIEEVLTLAARVQAAFEAGIEDGRITPEALFDTRYRPIPRTDPRQFMARFTPFCDTVLPPIQEEALRFDKRVVFCVAVDRQGYLPTHNRQFSQRPRQDPVWNAAHCRNRRIFDDRVGLKAGRNIETFLLQVYRRDMGGGRFAMMKDLSAPIMVKGRHWGGLRLAYLFR